MPCDRVVRIDGPLLQSHAVKQVGEIRAHRILTTDDVAGRVMRAGPYFGMKTTGTRSVLSRHLLANSGTRAPPSTECPSVRCHLPCRAPLPQPATPRCLPAATTWATAASCAA